MAEKSGLTGEKYRKFLVEAVKAAGQMMIDNAEDVVGHIDLMTDFCIKFEFPQGDRGGIPEMTIIKSHLPSTEVIDGLLDTRYKLIHNDSDKEESSNEN